MNIAIHQITKRVEAAQENLTKLAAVTPQRWKNLVKGFEDLSSAIQRLAIIFSSL